MVNDNVVRAQAGDRVPFKQKVEVGPTCDANNGLWYCCTHEEMFDNQFAKDIHIRDDVPHVMAWFCFEHGLEQP